jgi:cytoskeletal protein CcmA (bactofilin family)
VSVAGELALEGVFEGVVVVARVGVELEWRVDQDVASFLQKVQSD